MIKEKYGNVKLSTCFKPLVWWLAIVLSPPLTAQNLVPNPSFENYSQCPTGTSQVYHLDDWLMPSVGSGSADYFNSCNTTSTAIGVPTNMIGYQVPYSGDAYVGVYAMYMHPTFTWSIYREYVSVQLSSPLVAGETYDFSMMVSRGDRSKGYIDKMGAYFSVTPVTHTSSHLSHLTPQVETPTGYYMSDTANWMPVTGSFVASGGEQYVTLGNFKDEQSSGYTVDNPSVAYACYMFIDEVSLVHACTAPTIDAGPDQTICPGTPVTLTGSGAPTLSWNNGVTDGVAFSPTATNTYVLTGTAADGCTNTDTVTVTINSSITTDLGPDVLDCTGGSITLDAQNSGATYLWSDNSTNQTLTVSQSGTYYVEVENGGCTTSDTIEVIISTPPAVDAGPDQEACEATPVTLTGSGAPTLSWNNGVTDGVAFTPTATNTYILTGTAANGCTNTDTVSVVVNPLPTPQITGGLDYCEGESVSLDATPGMVSYSWSNGATSTNNSNLTIQDNPVSVTVTDGNGCVGTSVPVNLVEHANPIVDLGSGANMCTGGSVQLDAQNNGSSYLWSTGETTQTIIASMQGTYDVAVTTTMGCQGADTTDVVEVVPMEVDAGPDQIICLGEEVTLEATGTGTLTWDNGVEDNVPFAPANTLVYTVVQVDANNCINTDDVLVEVEELPEANFTYYPAEIDIANSEVSFTNTTINGDSYQWSFGEGGSSTQEHPVYEYQEPGTYQVQLIAASDFGCVDTAYALLEVKDIPYFYVPNSFTPDGDGINDVFIPKLSGSMPASFELFIFNRWGEVIYQSNDYTHGWDGTYQGVDCPIDSYVWLIKMTEKDGVVISDYKGHVNLVR